MDLLGSGALSEGALRTVIELPLLVAVYSPLASSASGVVGLAALLLGVVRGEPEGFRDDHSVARQVGGGRPAVEAIAEERNKTLAKEADFLITARGELSRGAQKLGQV